MRFYHPVGYLKVKPRRTEEEEDEEEEEEDEEDEEDAQARWPFLALATIAGPAATARLQPAGAGWIDPRAHVRATRARCAARGVCLVEEAAASLAREGPDSDVGPAEWRLVTAGGRRLQSARVVLAVGAFINVCGLLPAPLTLEIELWGKTLYHAPIAAADAAALLGQKMPVVSVSSPAGFDGVEAVSYAGSKAGTYVYFFPPTAV
eukprot:SAG11_NODE_876_length_6762_cov_16.770374_2_plen_206_part_00